MSFNCALPLHYGQSGISMAPYQDEVLGKEIVKLGELFVRNSFAIKKRT